MTDRAAVIPVVVFPGSNDDRDAAARARAPRRRRAARLAHRRRACRDGTAAVVLPGGFSYGDYLRCGAIARFSPVMQRGRRVRRRRRPRARDLQRLPDPDRGRAAARARCGRTRRSRSSAATCRSSSRRADTPFTTRCARGPAADDPREARRRLLVRRRRSCSPSSSANGQIVLRYARGREPERVGRRRRRRHERRRQRLRADAAPGARGRPAARLDRRRADPRLARRCGSVVGRARSSRPLPARSAGAGAGAFASAPRSRSRSRARSVTGPRRTTPSVEYAKRTSRSPRSVSSSSTTELNRSLARPLRERDALDERRRAPGSRCLRHATTVARSVQHVGNALCHESVKHAPQEVCGRVR